MHIMNSGAGRYQTQASESERARDALSHIDSGCTREEWVRIGMSIKSAGLTFVDFDEWSKSCDKYKSQQDCLSTWNSFSADGGVTSSTLFDLASKQGWKDIDSGAPKKTVALPHAIPAKKPGANVMRIWETCTPAPISHTYITRKLGSTDGLKVYPVNAQPLIIKNQNVAGWLVLPAWSDGRLQTLQFIPPNGGEKLNLSGAKFDDGFFTVGNMPDCAYTGEIDVVEGIGQAWAANQAKEVPAIVTFGAGRMPRITKLLRAGYQNARLVIVPDKGKEAQAAKIAAAVSGYWVKMPINKPTNYDINDYLIEYGADALATLLNQKREPKPPYPEPQIDHASMPDYAESETLEYAKAESGKCVITSTVEPFPGLMTEIVNSALEAAHKPQPELTILSVLLGMSSTCTGEYILPGGGRLNLYGTGIAGTGCGKEHPRNVAELIAGAGSCQVIGQPGSGAGLEDLLESNKNFLLGIDEIAHLLDAINGSKKPPYLIDLAGNLLRLFTASKGIYRTRALAKGKGCVESAKSIHHPCVNLLGFATPEKLGKAVGVGNIEDGLLGRVLFAMGSDGIKPRRGRHQFLLPCSVIERLKEIGRFTQDVHISMTADANSMLDDLLIDFDTTAIQATTLFERALKMRSFEKCERIAGVLAVWDDPQKPLVNLNHVRWAANFVRYSDSTVIKFCADFMHGGQVQADAALILKTMKRVLVGELVPNRSSESEHIKNGRLPWTFMLKASRLSKKDFDYAVDYLVDLGDIETLDFKVKRSNGREYVTKCLFLGGID